MRVVFIGGMGWMVVISNRESKLYYTLHRDSLLFHDIMRNLAETLNIRGEWNESSIEAIDNAVKTSLLKG
jgi:hypothetical protein